jgi:hypothetical protein
MASEFPNVDSERASGILDWHGVGSCGVDSVLRETCRLWEPLWRLRSTGGVISMK